MLARFPSCPENSPFSKSKVSIVKFRLEGNYAAIVEGRFEAEAVEVVRRCGDGRRLHATASHDALGFEEIRAAR